MRTFIICLSILCCASAAYATDRQRDKAKARAAISVSMACNTTSKVTVSSASSPQVFGENRSVEAKPPAEASVTTTSAGDCSTGSCSASSSVSGRRSRR